MRAVSLSLGRTWMQFAGPANAGSPQGPPRGGCIHGPHVAARIQQQLEALGVAFRGGNINRRNAVLVALVDVAARSQQQLEALGVAFRGGSVNRRTAVVVALVDVAAR